MIIRFIFVVHETGNASDGKSEAIYEGRGEDQVVLWGYHSYNTRRHGD